MTISNVALSDLYLTFFTRFNQSITQLNEITDGNATLSGTITMTNPGTALNVASGVIKGDGGLLSNIQSSQLSTIPNSVLENTQVSVSSSNAALIVTDGVYTLGNAGNIVLSLDTTSDQTSSSASQLATAKAVYNVNVTTAASFGKANTNASDISTLDIKTTGAFAKANTNAITVTSAFAKANTNAITVTSAFAKANTNLITVGSAFAKANTNATDVSSNAARLTSAFAQGNTNATNISSNAARLTSAFAQSNTNAITVGSSFAQANSAISFIERAKTLARGTILCSTGALSASFGCTVSKVTTGTFNITFDTAQSGTGYQTFLNYEENGASQVVIGRVTERHASAVIVDFVNTSAVKEDPYVVDFFIIGDDS